MPQPRTGGSFAPPIDENMLAGYQLLAETAPPEIRDAMSTLINCYSQWWEQPESSPAGSEPHPSGRGTIVPLDEPIAKALWDHIPWPRELRSMADLFESIDAVAHRDLRNAAFHLLWFARELDLDREPMTADRL